MVLPSAVFHRRTTPAVLAARGERFPVGRPGDGAGISWPVPQGSQQEAGWHPTAALCRRRLPRLETCRGAGGRECVGLA